MKPNPKLIAIGSILAISLTLGTYSALSVYCLLYTSDAADD